MWFSGLAGRWWRLLEGREVSRVESLTGRKRDVALFRTLSTSAGLQITSIVGALVSLPFVTRSLSTAEYGVVVTLSGFISLLSFADFGAGAALTDNLARSPREPGSSQARDHVAAAMVS